MDEFGKSPVTCTQIYSLNSKVQGNVFVNKAYYFMNEVHSPVRNIIKFLICS